MKKLTLILLLCIASLYATAQCNAAFSYQVDPNNQLHYTFYPTNNTSGMQARWLIGGNGFLYGDTMDYVFPDRGIYNVFVAVYDSLGWTCYDEQEQILNVGNVSLTVDFELIQQQPDPTGCAYSIKSYSDNVFGYVAVVDGFSYVINFNPDTTFGIAPLLIVAPGNHPVCVWGSTWIIGSGGDEIYTDTLCLNIYLDSIYFDCDPSFTVEIDTATSFITLTDSYSIDNMHLWEVYKDNIIVVLSDSLAVSYQAEPGDTLVIYHQYTAPKGCFGEIWDTVIVPYKHGTGLDEVTAITNTTLYPNPAGESVTLQIQAAAITPATLRITNLLGQAVDNRTLYLYPGKNIRTLDISGLAKGMYYVTLDTENGRTVTKFTKY